MRLVRIEFEPPTLNVFLIWGQSNADGRVASSLGPSWINDDVVDEVKVWTGSDIEPYNLTDNGPSGNGSSWVLDQSESKYSFVHVALHEIAQVMDNVVACQVTSGASPIAPRENERGSWSADFASIHAGTPKLLQELLGRYTALKTFAEQRGYRVVPRALIGHHGESDSVAGGGSGGDPAAYEGRLENLIAAVRTHVGAPELPVIMGTVPSFSDWYDATIRSAHLAIAAGDANVYCRDNNDLTLFDGLHFDAAGCNTFGEWVASTFSAL